MHGDARNAVAITVLNVFRGFAENVYRVFISAYMAKLGYSMTSIGLVSALSSIIGALASPLVGFLLDVWSSRLITALTGFFTVASLLLVAFGGGVEVITISYALFSLAFYFAQPARAVFLARSVGVTRLGTVISLTTLPLLVIGVVAPVAGGILITVYGYANTFLLLSLVALIGTAAFLVLSRELGVAGDGRRQSLVEAYKSFLLPSKQFASLYLFASIDRAAWSLWYPLLSAYLLSNGYTEFEIGFIQTISGLVQALLTPLAGRLTDRFGAFLTLTLSEATVAVGVLLLVFPQAKPLVIASMILTGASIAFWIPGYSTYIPKVFSNPGEVFASLNAVRSLVAVPAPYISGALYDTLSPTTPFTASSAMLAIATYIAVTSLRKLETALPQPKK